MFNPGDQAWAAPKDGHNGPESAHFRLIKDHGKGPFTVIGTHPRGLNGDQLIYLGTPHGKTMVDGRILQSSPS